MPDEITAREPSPSRFWTGNYFNEGMTHKNAFDKLKEECGVFGVYGHPDASVLSYYGLHALQHRGQESSGICTSDGSRFHYYRDEGLVKEVFDEQVLEQLVGPMSISHVRYTSDGDRPLMNAQPLVFNYYDGELALATNGSIINAGSIRKDLEKQGSIFQTTSDTEVIAHLIARSKREKIEDAVKDALAMLNGGFALLLITRDKLFATVDRHGLRPLVMGKLGDATLFASETCAFDVVGATYERDVQPGELIVISDEGLKTDRYAPEARKALCAMEYIYFARPDSNIDEINIHSARKRMGKQLAIESSAEADVVTGVPDSSISAAIGYAEQTGIPYELGLIKNRYIGRTFIQPTQLLREQGVKMKLSAVRGVVEGKRVIMIDDSIVRGTTSRRIVQLLREAGAKEVHVRISSPPFQNPCFYGIDTPTREDLIASERTVEQIRQEIDADSLHFLSREGLIQSIQNDAAAQVDEQNSGFCTACFDHNYPTPIRDDVAEQDARQDSGQISVQLEKMKVK